MPIVFHEASIPVFRRYLDRLLGLVDAAEKHVRSRALDDAEILEARLAPDMLPFETQVKIAANFTLRSSFPLAGQDVPPYGEFPVSFAGLRACLARASALLATLEPVQFESCASRVIESRAGSALVSLPAAEFLFQYALPNFFFHVTAAYAILRSAGVPIGKADFDGLHVY